ncbi:MAG: adventurous gliding motility protein CglE [Myxococcota bacterium]
MAILSPSAGAQETPSPGVEQGGDIAVEETAAKGAKDLRAVVRGLYLEARVGGGAIIKGADVEGDDGFNGVLSGDEGTGFGTSVAMSVGYDIADSFALEFNTGGVMASGGRSDRVRDISMLYAGVSGRLLLGSGRLKYTVTPGISYVRADNAVETPDSGIAATVRTGIEYFVHVRHFSVGIEALAFVPLSPLRMFVGLTPTLKYTF